MITWRPVYIHERNCVTPLGQNVEENWQQLLAGKSAIVKQDVGLVRDVFVAKVPHKVEGVWKEVHHETTLESMLLKAAEPIVKKHKPGPRTAFVLATTKGEIGYLAEKDAAQAMLSVLARKVARKLYIVNEPIIVSHACVSGVLAINVAKRLIQMGLYDDAIVLAGDEASEFVLSGFQAFQAMSPFPCKPFDKDRAGVSLGDAAACIYLSLEAGAFQVTGEAAINDANHISGPSRTGEGLYQSVMRTMQEANVSAGDIDFVSAHGTATLYNDEMEAIAFNRSGLGHAPVNSLKGYFGHTLGAAGLLETVISLQAMEQGLLVPSLGFQELGTTQALHVVSEWTAAPIRKLLKTASGFGGSNAAILIEQR